MLRSALPVFEIARVLVRLDHVARVIEYPNDSMNVNGSKTW